MLAARVGGRNQKRAASKSSDEHTNEIQFHKHNSYRSLTITADKLAAIYPKRRTKHN